MYIMCVMFIQLFEPQGNALLFLFLFFLLLVLLLLIIIIIIAQAEVSSPRKLGSETQFLQ